MLSILGGPVIIQGLIHNLEPGYHGFHIHGNPSAPGDCGAAGGHFNPEGVSNNR